MPAAPGEKGKGEGMKPDEALAVENRRLRRERDDARRWAAAWKEGARANHDAYQGVFIDYREAMRQYDAQQKRACEVEALCRELLVACNHARRAIGTLPQDALGRDIHSGHYYRDELVGELSFAIAKAKGESDG